MSDRRNTPWDRCELTILVESLGIEARVERDSLLRSVLEAEGVTLGGLCDGRGTCGQCEVVIREGAVSPPTRAELRRLSERTRRQGHRLACQTRVLEDLTVTVEKGGHHRHRILTTGTRELAALSPPVRAYLVQLSPPDLTDPRGDDRRLVDEIRCTHGVTCESVDTACLREAPILLPDLKWSARALMRGTELIGLKAQDSPVLGLAVDLGTTGIAAYLCDLEAGRIRAEAGMENPQHLCGGDIITRIAAAGRSHQEADRLQRLAVQAINGLSSRLTKDANCSVHDIAEFVVVGNTAMHHLLLGLPLARLARSPHVPAVSLGVEAKARHLGLDGSKGAYAYLPPNPAAFVGSDHTAMLLACSALERSEPTLFIDMGTNTEICLVAEENMTCVSCASGPAFEGGNLSCGMSARPGAIERLTVTDRGVEFQTIDGQRPMGLCGSGMVDLLCEMARVRAIDGGGRLVKEHERVREFDGRPAFVVLEAGEGDAPRPILITQQDVRSLQLAKAAIAAGTQVLLRSCGLTHTDLGCVVVAGAFGSYMNIGSAQRVGLLPPVDPQQVEQVGNAAGLGAAMLLVSETSRDRAKTIAGRLGYLELAAHDAFKSLFLQAIPIPQFPGEETPVHENGRIRKD